MAEVKTGRAAQIAVVDDDFRVRESLGSLLESAGYTFAVFESAEVFLQSRFFAEVSCLITDVRMPGMGGLELQRRAKLQRPELPVICITAHNDDEAKRRAVLDGAVGFLRKPFSAAELLKSVRHALVDPAPNQDPGCTNGQV